MKIEGGFQPGTISWTVEDWRPDAALIAEGDRYLGLALRCWSGSMSDRQMRRRLEHVAGEVYPEPPDIGPSDAAIALAEHCDLVDVSPELTARLLAQLSVIVPGWNPTDADDIAELVSDTRRRDQCR